MSSPYDPNEQNEELAEARRVTIEDVQQAVPVIYEDRGNNPVPVTARGGSEAFPVTVQGPVSASVTLRTPEAPNIDEDPGMIINAVIRNRAEAISFNRYREFIDRVLCNPTTSPGGDHPSITAALRGAGANPLPAVGTKLSNVYAYELLKSATDAFLLVECGLIPRIVSPVDPNTSNLVIEGRRDPRTGIPSKTDVPGITGAKMGKHLEAPDIQKFLSQYLDSRGLPYLELISSSLANVQPVGDESPYCMGVLPSRLEPTFIELIWNYWHEEGMLVQTINAISLRFQNRRLGTGRDPLAHLELDPLRPLNNLLWGYIQDEQNRLTIARRAYEYQHEYGLTIFGRAVPKLLPADRRSMFIEAFHNLLHLASVFYREQSDTMVIADAFPLLNSLKEVHLILAEGAHNQFGDLPWTARVEMLLQKWLLSRPEIREFLGGRIMVPYQESWMGIVDSMKALQGWGDVSVRYFHDLAVFGEQLLLSLRYGNWSQISDEQSARNWANYWRFAVQGYIHAYRAATGVDLASARESQRLSPESYVQPSVHLRKRLTAARRPQLSE
ncbi:MAG TPA: hypothetical protein VK422_19475 [Pyrinomonadaceae bacterium]|nr:hypothetical protein [Pyrinomonadaceae bacterium]